MMVAMLIVAAFAIDFGYLLVEKTQLQRSADSAAMAAAWDLVDYGGFAGDPNMTTATTRARSSASRFAGYNTVGTIAPTVDTNTSNSTSGDITIGYLADWSDPDAELDTSDPRTFNAVKVRVRRDDGRNGRVPSFFARVIGVSGFAAEASATAALVSNIRGFRVPLNGSNLPILPIAVDEDTWEALEAGLASDDWGWDAEEVDHVSDGLKELNLYPEGTGSPGNRGTVDIGGNNNSTSDLSRQIVEGISPADLEHHGGKLEFDDNGELFLNADPGISAGIQDELAAIVGQARIIPVFREINGNGNNANYTIVKWVGIRIMDVDLTGNSKHVIVQPATVITPGAISGEVAGQSQLIFTAVTLVR
jgi:hypothetical protein